MEYNRRKFISFLGKASIGAVVIILRQQKILIPMQILG